MSENNGNTEFNFDLTETVVPVVIGGKNYLLVECSCEAESKSKDAGVKAVRFEQRKGRTVPVGIGEGSALSEQVLLQQCLFEFDTATNVRTPVTLDFIKGLKSKVFNPLLKKLKEISGMDDEETTGKNSQSGTETTAT